MSELGNYYHSVLRGYTKSLPEYYDEIDRHYDIQIAIGKESARETDRICAKEFEEEINKDRRNR